MGDPLGNSLGHPLWNSLGDPLWIPPVDISQVLCDVIAHICDPIARTLYVYNQALGDPTENSLGIHPQWNFLGDTLWNFPVTL